MDNENPCLLIVLYRAPQLQLIKNNKINRLWITKVFVAELEHSSASVAHSQENILD